MIPISLHWDTRKGSILIQWNNFFSMGWKNRKVLTKLIGFTIPLGSGPKKIHVRVAQRVYLKEAIGFLKEWEIKRVEGTVSFADPMVNGLLYGLSNIIETWNGSRKIHLTVNFLGENWCSGEATISPKRLFDHLRRWIFPLFREVRGRRL